MLTLVGRLVPIYNDPVSGLPVAFWLQVDSGEYWHMMFPASMLATFQEMSNRQRVKVTGTKVAGEWYVPYMAVASVEGC